MAPHEESNLDLRFRKPLFYPLNYGADIDFIGSLRNFLIEIKKQNFVITLAVGSSAPDRVV